jgi:hypothetical protein
MNYDGTHRWASLETAGWFTIGFPFACGMSLLSAVFVALLARKINRLIAGLALAFMLACVIFAIRSALPEARLAAIIGERAAQSATIERLVIRDSFNEGETTWGVISGPAELLGLIAKHRSLELTHEAWPDGRLRSFFPDLFPELEMHEENPKPEVGDAASDKRSVFYRRAGTKKIYFRRE